MGFISRKVLPACGSMCVCCPALRPSSRQPVKRYKKLLGEIFPKTAQSGPPNERKIIKLCEYAARNPIRIPKIAKFLEQRSYKELRCEHINSLRIITETYSKLLCICKEQMAYFASSLLNVIDEFLDDKRQADLRIVGCKTLTKFIYSQADSTYAHSIEDLVNIVCKMAHIEGEEYSIRCLRAASLECLSAMVWYMSTFSHIFADFDEIVYVCLDNYGTDDTLDDEVADTQDSNKNWVEVVRSNARGGDASPQNVFLRPPREIKDASTMTREEIETPRIWAQICIQKITEMAKESTTMRQILDPMFTYFDSRNQWEPRRGLAIVVLSDMLHMVKNSGNVQVILGYIVRHLDHKNVVHDPRVKSDIIQICSCLIQQLKLQNGMADIGVISDLYRHLKKSLQATGDLVGQQEANWNTLLQNSIEDCLLEISKGINDAKPLVDMMTIALEELPAVTVVSRATIGSLLILAHIISLSYVHSHSLAFPETLLLQLLKAMMHPDVETRIGAHRVFSVLIVRTATGQKHENTYFRPEYLYEPKRWQSRTASTFVSATALLEKLRKEKEGCNIEKGLEEIHVDGKEREITDEEWKPARTRKNSSLHKFSCSVIDRGVCSPSSSETEPKIAILSDDQIAMALSAFWIQANQADNLPYNFEAISHSFSLTVLSARLKNLNHQNVLRMFQIPLSIRNMALDADGVISPSHQRSLYTMSAQMLIFGGKTYHVHELCNHLKTLMSANYDPFLSIGEDMQLYVRPHMDLDEYGSHEDKQAALSTLEHFRKAAKEFDEHAMPSLVQSLSKLTDLDTESLIEELSKTFSPDDGLLFGPYTVLDWFYNPDVAHSDESFSVDEESSENASVDGCTVRESPTSDMTQSVSKMTNPQVISVGQLLESALQVAGQVAGTTISTSPLPYGTMTTQCEALGMGTRRKLSTWLGCNNDPVSGLQVDKMPDAKTMKVDGYRPEKDGFVTDSWLAMKLPPASPFDNFLKAARY